MTDRSQKRIYFVGGTPELRAVVETALAFEDTSVCCFCSHQDCLQKLSAKACDLLIIDLGDCDSGGYDVLAETRRMAPWIMSLAIVEHASVDCAVGAMKAGACDCLEKPVSQERLRETVRMHLSHTSPPQSRRPLTQMEIQVLQLILAGRTSLEIAVALHRSKRTIDVHRKNIMRKLHACSVVDLVRRGLGMGFLDDRPHDEPAETDKH